MPQALAQKYPLLTRHDLEHIRRLGLPSFPEPGLMQVEPGNRLAFTERGRQYYEAALKVHGLEVELDALDYPELLRLSLAINARLIADNRQRLRQALATGQVSSRERAAAACLSRGTAEP